MTGPTDIAHFLDAYAAGTAVPSEVVAAALDNVAARDGEIRAFITVDAEGARAASHESDKRYAAGRARALEGVPIAIKDNIAVAGLPWTDGTAAFAKRIAGRDAHVVDRLKAAGAIVLGKLNMHEGALGATTDNPHWGRCINPLRAGYTPGGSSGGSAAAIAAGFVPATLGTDTMGSVRIPAAYCGLWGVKPTRGLIGTTGLSYLSWTLDTIGPLGRSAGDLAAMLDAMTGFDRDDPAALDLPFRAPADADAPLRLGIPRRDATAEEPEVTAAFDALVSALEASGAEMVTVEVAGWDPTQMRRAGLLVAEAEAGHLLADLLDADDPGLSRDFKAALAFGRKVLSPRLVAAHAALRTMRPAVLAALDGVEALLLPTAPQRAFAHDTPVPVNQADYTALANAAGLPAVAFPLAAPGLPASAQLLGRAFDDRRLIQLGDRVAGMTATEPGR